MDAVKKKAGRVSLIFFRMERMRHDWGELSLEYKVFKYPPLSHLLCKFFGCSMAGFNFDLHFYQRSTLP